MAKTEIAKASDTACPSPGYLFYHAHEMDRMFERFEHGFPASQPVPRRKRNSHRAGVDVRDNPTSITIEAELPGSGRRMFPSRWPMAS